MTEFPIGVTTSSEVIDFRSPDGRDWLRLPLALGERRLLLVVLDLVALNSALLLSLWLHPERPFRLARLFQNPLWFLLLSFLWLLLAQAFDVYDLNVAGRLSTAAPAVLKAGALTVGVYLLIPYVTPMLPAYRRSLLAFFAVTIVLLLTIRGLYALSLSQPMFNRRALVIGAGWAGHTILDALQEHSDGSYQVVGFVDDDPTKQGSTLHVNTLNGQSSNVQTFSVLGDRHALTDLISQYQITTLILAITHEVNGELLQVLMDCLESGVEIMPMPVLYERLTGRVPVEHVGDNWNVSMPIHHPATGGLNRLVKRISDVILASLGLLVLIFLFPFVALAIYLDSPGPIIYTQERIGQGGKTFRVYKFRSMFSDAEDGEAVWAKEKDPRITQVGRLLRATHLDEFPQFINILKGDMSAVGPRPERPEFVEDLAQEIPFYKVRHAVKPGMAGWGLVKQGYSSSKKDALLKLQYDLYYIKHQSLWLDLVILVKTIVDTVTFRGR